MKVKKIEDITKAEAIVLLNKCWMTHDGMWFFSCLQEYGIEAANKLNKSAIEYLAPFEIGRLKKILDFAGESFGNFDEFRVFFNSVAELFIPDFMGGEFRINKDHSMDMMMRPDECFAYKGIKRLGVIEDYECGVMYRIECWLRNLGLEFESDTHSLHCLFHHKGHCQKHLKFTNFQNNQPGV